MSLKVIASFAIYGLNASAPAVAFGSYRLSSDISELPGCLSACVRRRLYAWMCLPVCMRVPLCVCVSSSLVCLKDSGLSGLLAMKKLSEGNPHGEESEQEEEE